MSKVSDPTRWRDDPTTCSEELARAFDAYERDGPSAAQLANIRAGLLTRLDSELNAAPWPRAMLVRRAAWALAVAGLSGLGIASWASRTGHQVDVARVAPATTSAKAAEAVPALSEEDVRTDDTGERASVCDRNEEALPDAAPSPRHGGESRPRERRERGAIAQPRDAPDVAGELALLSLARRALSSAPKRARKLTEEHARLYPRGVFVEERALLEIEALVKEGAWDQAERRAQLFAQQRPRSPHLERLRALLDAR